MSEKNSQLSIAFCRGAVATGHVDVGWRLVDGGVAVWWCGGLAVGRMRGREQGRTWNRNSYGWRQTESRHAAARTTTAAAARPPATPPHRMQLANDVCASCAARMLDWRDRRQERGPDGAAARGRQHRRPSHRRRSGRRPHAQPVDCTKACVTEACAIECRANDCSPHITRLSFVAPTCVRSAQSIER